MKSWLIALTLVATGASAQTLKSIKLDAAQVQVGQTVTATVGLESSNPPNCGLRVRWGLGLRENLFVINRERDASGGVKRFIFTGKGWGHGVGLCQVGSFGMARAGSTYDRILQHYYTGITLAQAY